ALRVVYEEVCQRQELGQEVSLAELRRRFPRWRDELGVLLDCVQLLGLTPRVPRFPAVGETLGEFRLLGELGRGGRGRVYLPAHGLAGGGAEPPLPRTGLVRPGGVLGRRLPGRRAALRPRAGPRPPGHEAVQRAAHRGLAADAARLSPGVRAGPPRRRQPGLA